MSDINQVTLTGNLTRDPELRSASSGTDVLRFGIASNHWKSDGNGGGENVADFIDCTLFGKRASSLEGILHKGMKVAISGSLRYSSWQTDDGQKRSKLEVNCFEVVLLQKREDNANTAPQKAYNSPYSTPAPVTPPQAPTPVYSAPQQPTLPTYTAPQQQPHIPAGDYQALAQSLKQPQQAPASDVYDEDIPF